MNPIQLRRGDILRLRRPHPCGNDLFEVVRLGADIGLHCTRCGRRLLLARSLLARRMEGFVSRGPDPQPPIDMDSGGLSDAGLSGAGPRAASLSDFGPDSAVTATDAPASSGGPAHADSPGADSLGADGPNRLDPDPLDQPRPAPPAR